MTGPELIQAFTTLPRPPWPNDWRCQATGCEHRKDEHASPLVENGRCLYNAAGWCSCDGWDPLTPEQWQVALAGQRAGL